MQGDVTSRRSLYNICIYDIIPDRLMRAAARVVLLIKRPGQPAKQADILLNIYHLGAYSYITSVNANNYSNYINIQ